MNKNQARTTVSAKKGAQTRKNMGAQTNIKGNQNHNRPQGQSDINFNQTHTYNQQSGQTRTQNIQHQQSGQTRPQNKQNQQSGQTHPQNKQNQQTVQSRGQNKQNTRSGQNRPQNKQNPHTSQTRTQGKQNPHKNQGQTQQSRTNQPKRNAKNTKQNVRRRTPEEIAAIKAERARAAAEERARLKAEREIRRREAIVSFKAALVIFALRAAVTVGCAVAFFAVFTAIFFMSLFAHDSPDVGSYTYQIGIDEDVYSTQTIDGNKIYRDGAFYVELTSAATYLRLITTGDISQIRFILRDDGSDNVYFNRDSASVTINGREENLTAPIRMENGEIWVPVEFFERYVYGVDIKIDDETRTVRLSRALTTDSSLSVSAYEIAEADDDRTNDIELEDVLIEYDVTSFKLRSSEPIENIPEYSLGVELLEQTDPVAKIIAAQSGELIGEETPNIEGTTP